MVFKNQTFSSLEELLLAIGKYGEESLVNLFVRSNHLVETYQKKLKKKVVNPDLGYGEITFWCVYGGNFKARGEGKRPNQRLVLVGFSFLDFCNIVRRNPAAFLETRPYRECQFPSEPMLTIISITEKTAVHTHV